MILANIFGFGNPVELAIVAGVVVLLFGGGKIAGFGKSLGEGLKEFRKATSEEGKSPAEVSSGDAKPAIAESEKTKE